MTDITDFVLPSSSTDRAKIKDAVYEVVGALREIKDKRSYITDTKKEMKEKFQIPPKIFSKLVKIQQEANMAEVRAEHETVEAMYDTLFESNNSTSAASTYSDE